jgi:cyclic pyranopterin phosphate synthase
MAKRRKQDAAGRSALGAGGSALGARPAAPKRAADRFAREGGKLTHVDAGGEVRMVDVSAKPVSAREAVARGRIRMSAEALKLIRAGAIKKGDPLQSARLAGIMAAKRTADLIPLCHPLALTHVDVSLVPAADGYAIEARVRTTDRTGVEMEALTAVAVAALTIYDMVKAVDKAMVIDDIALVEKHKTPLSHRG